MRKIIRRGWPAALIALFALVPATGSTHGAGAPTGGNSEALLQAYLEDERREDARRAYVNSAEGRAARKESRTAFRDKGADHAAAIAVDNFGGLVLDPFWQGVEARTGARVLEYRSDRVALIKHKGDAHASLLDSTPWSSPMPISIIRARCRCS